MPLTFGPPINYPSPAIPIPSNAQVEPEEGRLQVPIEILWGSMGGTGKVVGFDLQEDGVHPIRQIASVIADNSECTVPVTLIFPDTSEKLTIPANAKRMVVGVYTNGLAFVASAPTAVVTDITRLQILNYRVPPIYIP